MNDNISDQVIDSSNLPSNKKAKAIQKRRAAENSYEALQLKKSAAIYLRVSSEMQVDGFSIEAQKNACLKYAAEQGYEVTDSHIYIDEAYSAKNEDRPEFKRLMIGAHSSEFSLIIIHKMDRFERNFRAMTNTLEDLANIGVRVYSIHENLELANTLTVNLFGIINEHYIQNLSWETAKGKHQAAKEGYFIGSRVPFGYRKWKIGDPPEMDKRLLLVDEKEGPALQHCFEMYATGHCSFDDLADYLNNNGFISRSGRAFRQDTMRSMLENPIYVGIIEYQGTKKDTYLTYKGKHQPLVSTELFNQVASVREIRGNDKSRIKRDNNDLKEKYLVQNLICCESCRRKLRVYATYNNNIIYYYYRDFSEERGLTCKDSKLSISAPFVEGLVLCFLSSIILPRNWIDQVIAEGAENDTYTVRISGPEIMYPGCTGQKTGQWSRQNSVRSAAIGMKSPGQTRVSWRNNERTETAPVLSGLFQLRQISCSLSSIPKSCFQCPVFYRLPDSLTTSGNISAITSRIRWIT